jgi:hypothetical protein
MLGLESQPAPARTLNLANQQWTTVDPVVVDGGSAVMYSPDQILKSGDSGGVPNLVEKVRRLSGSQHTHYSMPAG